MSGSAPTNSSAVQFEQQQAADAAQKETQRQARLTQGQTLIDQIFNGSPVMGTRSQNFDWSSFNPTAASPLSINPQQSDPNAGLPAGYKAVQIPGKSGTPAAAPQYAAPTGTFGGTGGGGQQPTLMNPSIAGGGGGGGGSTWEIQGPDGKIYKQGDALSYDSQYDTGGRTGGFDDAFYQKYNQKVLDYYMPQEKRQYDVNTRNLRYNLANSGNLISSTAADQQGEQAYNDALARAAIVGNANAQTGQLKQQIQGNKESLINQLYATEDPTLTANLAESSAKASQLQDPTLTPGAAFLTPALSVVGSAAGGLGYGPIYGQQPGGYQPQPGQVPPADRGSGVLRGN